MHKIYEIESNQNIKGKMKPQKVESTSNASVFLIFPNEHFLKTILARRRNGIYDNALIHMTIINRLRNATN